MKKMFLLCLVLFAVSSLGAQTLPEWKEGYLDIHNIATGKGDATFIIMPDGTKMLVDAGDMTGSRFICPAYPSDSLTPGQWISRYIRNFSVSAPGKPEEVDYFSLTHYHSDHFGCNAALRDGPHYMLAGIMDVAESVHFGKIVSRDYPNYDFPTSSTRKETTGAAAIEEYIKFVNYQRDSNNTCAEKFVVGSHKQFALKNNPKKYKGTFDVYNVAGNGYITTGKGNKVVPMFTVDPAILDENMFSTALLFSYGKFSYYNGGDIGGGKQGAYLEWRDFERLVADRIGQVTVMKADHHAWKEAMNSYFIWKTRPQAIFVQCSHINHPWKDTVQRLVDPLLPIRPEIYVTTDSGREQVGEELFSKLMPAGHIVVRVYEGGKAYQIFVLDNRSLDYRIIYQTEVRTL